MIKYKTNKKTPKIPLLKLGSEKDKLGSWKLML